MTTLQKPLASDHLVKKQFGAQASEYLTSAVHAGGADLARLRELLAAEPAGTVLDLGCGAGHCTYQAAEVAKRVIAFDLTEQMLAVVATEANERGYTNVETVQGDVMELPFTSGSVDVAVSRFSAHHWPELATPLREVHRVLGPGKRAIFIDVVAPPVPVADTWLQALELLRDPSHVRDYSVAEWQRIASEAGFTVEHTETMPLRLEFTSWVERMAVPKHFVHALRELHHVAPTEVQDALAIEADGTMSVPVAVMVFTT